MKHNNSFSDLQKLTKKVRPESGDILICDISIRDEIVSLFDRLEETRKWPNVPIVFVKDVRKIKLFKPVL